MGTPPNPEFTHTAADFTTTQPLPHDRSRVAPAWHTIIFVLVTFGLAGLQAHQQPQMATLNLSSKIPIYAVMIAFELILLGYVWIGVRIAGKTVRDIVGGKWNRPADFWIDVGVAAGFWCVVWGMLIVMGLLLGKNNNGIAAVKALMPRTAAEMLVWTCLSVTAGFCEEFIFRGYLQRQFFALTGKAGFAVVLQAIVFGSAHIYQGWKGALTITVYGALFGILAAWRKSLRPGMMQHAAQDTFTGLIASFLLRHHYL
jgi:uncharacterized protein